MAVTEMEQTHMDIITDNQREKWGPFLDLSEALAPFSPESGPRFAAGLDLLDDAVMRTLDHVRVGSELNWQGQLVVMDAPC